MMEGSTTCVRAYPACMRASGGSDVRVRIGENLACRRRERGRRCDGRGIAKHFEPIRVRVIPYGVVRIHPFGVVDQY